MVKHYNPSIAQDANRILNTKGDFLPEEVDGPIATLAINPCINIVKAATSASTLLTVDSTRDFYIVGMALSGSKAAGDAATSLQITGVVGGATVNLLLLQGVTLTAERGDISIVFPLPGLKMEPGNIALGNSGTWSSKWGCIYGYYRDVTKS